MEYIDLHVHSNKSDGTLCPTELVNYAAKSGLAAIALTDHDCVDGIKEARAASSNLAAQGRFIYVVPGVELSADYKKRDIHILGLFIDPDHPVLVSALEKARASRDIRNEKMVRALQKANIQITLKDLTFGTNDTVITRAHYARFLVEHGYVKDRKEAFRKYLDSDTPYYVRREYMQPKEAIETIRKAGGVPVLAHPLLYHLSPEGVCELVRLLSDAGLAGIEAIYSANTGTDEAFVRQLAAKFHLLISGGSDFHGANKPEIEIGTGRGNLRIPKDILTPLIPSCMKQEIQLFYTNSTI